MGHVLQKKFPVSAQDYKLCEEVGEGVSATVYRALCIPLNEIVAIKVLDLERCNNDLDGIRCEVQTMLLINHPNLLRAHCTFTTGQNLWVVMPYMSGGSCLHVMKSAFPEGFEEPVIVTVLNEVLKGLAYLHAHGHIHRDVKAGNILINSNGAVKLADFGVSACMFDTGERQRNRNTFVGTPCWMAPEVMQQLHGYDFKADIWSFGISALELAHGHAPFSKYPPMKVLLMTLQNAPPGLDYERDKKFSKSFKEMIAACLLKDPKKRPTAEKLLKHRFFKRSRPNDYLVQNILDGLSPLGERFKILKAKEADLLVQNKANCENQLSQQTYIRGISAWNFNIEDLKAQAALMHDDVEISNVEETSISGKSKSGHFEEELAPTVASLKRVSETNHSNSTEDGLDLQNMEDSLASFPVRSLQALKGYFDVQEDDVNVDPNKNVSKTSSSKELFQSQQPSKVEVGELRQTNGEILERSSSVPKNIASISGQRKNFLSGSLVQEQAFTTPLGVVRHGEREGLQKYPTGRNYSGPLLNCQRKDTNGPGTAAVNILDNKPEGAVVQQKGRFKVMSAEIGAKGAASTNSMVNPACGASTSSSVMDASILPWLRFLLQQNALQREHITRLIKFVEQTAGNYKDLSCGHIDDFSQLSSDLSRERELQSLILRLQKSVMNTVEELQTLKMKNAQLELQLNALNREDRPRETAQNL